MRRRRSHPVRRAGVLVGQSFRGPSEWTQDGRKADSCSLQEDLQPSPAFYLSLWDWEQEVIGILTLKDVIIFWMGNEVQKTVFPLKKKKEKERKENCLSLKHFVKIHRSEMLEKPRL